MPDLHKVGGVPAVMKYLLDLGLLHGDCMTVTGKTIAENLALVTSIIERDQDIIRDIKTRLKKQGTSELCMEIWLKEDVLQNYRKRRRLFQRNCGGF